MEGGYKKPETLKEDLETELEIGMDNIVNQVRNGEITTEESEKLYKELEQDFIKKLSNITLTKK